MMDKNKQDLLYKRIALDDFKSAFELYRKFDSIRRIAQRMGRISPNTLIEMFSGVGMMVLNQTVEHFDKELKAKLNELFPEDFEKLKDDDFKELLKIFKQVVGVK